MRYLPVPKSRRLQWLPRRRWSRRKGLNGVRVDPFDGTREFCLKAEAWGALQLATNIPANIEWRSLFEAGTEREGRLGKEGAALGGTLRTMELPRFGNLCRCTQSRSLAESSRPRKAAPPTNRGKCQQLREAIDFFAW